MPRYKVTLTEEEEKELERVIQKGVSRYDVRKLHNKLYHECRGNGKDAWQEDDPWA